MTKLRLNLKKITESGFKKSAVLSFIGLLILGIVGCPTNAVAESVSYNAQKVQDTRNFVNTEMVKTGKVTPNVAIKEVREDLSKQIGNKFELFNTKSNKFLETYECKFSSLDNTSADAQENYENGGNGQAKNDSIWRTIGNISIKLAIVAGATFINPIAGIATAAGFAIAGDAGDEAIDSVKKVVSTAISCIGSASDSKGFVQCATNGAFSALLGQGFSWYSYIEGFVNECVAKPGQNSYQLVQERQEILELAADADLLIGQLLGVDKLSGKNVEIYKHCVTIKGKDGQETESCAYYALNTEDGSLTTLSALQTGCEPLPFKLHEARSCLFCPLFNTIFNAIQGASNSAYSKLGNPLSTLIMIGLAIWIALMVLQNVSSMTRQDPLEFITKLFRASFKVIIAFFMLRNPSIVTNILIGPILKSGFDFGVSFLDHSGDSVLTNCKALKEYSSSVGGVLPGYLKTNLLCFVEAVQFELATAQAIGSSLMCISVHQGMSNLGPVARVWPDFTMMLQGALIYIIAFILTLAFGFYLIDATVQLGIFGVVLPFLLLCMPFKITASYFKTGVGVFMNSWFVYVFMGIVVKIVLSLIGQSLTGGKGGFSDIEAAINGNSVRTLQQLLSIGYSGFLVLLACCVFAVKLMMKVTDLAGQFGGGGLNLGIGNQIGGVAASGATGAARMVGSKAKSAVSGAANLKVWKGKDGKYKSLNDGISNLKTKAARGVVGAARSTVSAIFHPQRAGRALVNKFKGSSGRRDSAE